jgi:hypothetical protein
MLDESVWMTCFVNVVEPVVVHEIAIGPQRCETACWYTRLGTCRRCRVDHDGNPVLPIRLLLKF